MLTRLGEFTEGTHIVFRNLGKLEGRKTNLYGVWSKADVNRANPLGSIRWFGRWRKYVFEPTANTIYEETCMRDISQFIEEETKAHRSARSKNENKNQRHQ